MFFWVRKKQTEMDMSKGSLCPKVNLGTVGENKRKLEKNSEISEPKRFFMLQSIVFNPKTWTKNLFF